MMDDSQYKTRYQPLHQASHYEEHRPLLDVVAQVGQAESNERLASSQESHSSSNPGVLLHTVPDRTRRWHHIDDLDNFFRRVYKFHQSYGYRNMMLAELCDVVKLSFVICLFTLVTCGLNYKLLFSGESYVKLDNTTQHLEVVQMSFFDGVYSFSETAANCSFVVGVMLLFALLFLIGRIFYAVHNSFQYLEIQEFFKHALEIDDRNLQDVTWDEVKKQLIEVQLQQRMCVHKDILTSLDIYQLILRHQNYWVALIDQNVIPVHFNIPYIGEVTHLTKNYEFNLNILLFWGSHSLLQKVKDNKLRDPQSRKEAVSDLERNIYYLTLFNTFFGVFIFLYQLIYITFQNIERLKNEPGSFAGRCWSYFGRHYLRHYNELDHELTARLNRAHKHSKAYIDSFTSPAAIIFGSTLNFMAGAILVLFLAMTLFDDDFVKLVHVWSIILIVGFLMKASSAAIPDDNVVFIPEVMMKRILSHIHYLPRKYEGKVHTSEVRDDFSQLFQYKFVFIIEEVIAAISTPFILFFCLRHRAEDIVKFIHNFTVDVEGIGHVCSFAQMDLKKHGSAFWQPDAPESGETRPVPNYKPDDGRTELSLLHFTCNNPDWKPPKSGTAFITKVQGRAGAAAPQQLSTLYDTTGLSLDSLNLTVCERRLAEMRSNSVMGQQLSTSNQVQRSTDESVVPFDPALHGSIGSGMLSPNLLQASSMHQSSVGIQNSTFFALGAAMDADTSINSLTKIQRYQAAQDLGASCLYLRELNNQRQRISRGQVNMVTHQQPSTQYQDMRDDREVQSVFRHPLATNTNYGQDRLIPRSPSPPAVDPFQDAYMSNIVSTQPENVGSQYQSMLYSASTQIQQREQQQRDLEQQHQAAGSAFSDDNHFLHPSQR